MNNKELRLKLFNDLKKSPEFKQAMKNLANT